MAIQEKDWTLSKRGSKDAARHREKIRKAIKDNIADIISDEAIITQKGKGIVKVPVRGLKSYKFRYGKSGKGGAGIGQGKGKPGDIIDSKKLPGNQPDKKAGDQPGVDYLETEVDIEELIEMMLEDLQLPNIRKKEVAEVEVPRGFTFNSIEKVGLRPNIEKKRTVKESIKRTASYVRGLMARTGRSQRECEKALDLADGDLTGAEKLLKDANFSADDSLSKPRIKNPDVRYRTLKEDIERQSKAVVLAMMDVSGSMTTFKKYIARSFFWWMVQFLKVKYRHVEIRFIAHTTEAKLVTEEEFFHKGESGGTHCWSAYELALRLTETEYNPEEWNVYAFHFSDGEDWDADRTVRSVEKLMPKCSMVGYGEIRDDYSFSSNLSAAFANIMGADESEGEEGLEVLAKNAGGGMFLGVIISRKEDVYLALKEFFKKDRG